MTGASQQAQADEQDASMDTILASIRRIILEDEAGTPPTDAAHKPAVAEAEDDLLVLQPSMIVDAEGPKGAPMVEPVAASPHHGTQTAADLAAALFDEPEPTPPPAPTPVPPPVPPPVAVLPPPVAVQPAPVPVVVHVAPPPSPPPAPDPLPDQPLLAPAASLAAAQALASLQDAVRPEPPPPASLRLLRSGGPTIEDMVRDELRVQLKDWLDANLPSMVERLVAQEIGRLVGRG